MPSPLADLPRTSPWLIRLFCWYARGYVRKDFNAVRLLGDPPDTADPRPMLIYLNHPSWWDPMAIVLLIDRYFRHRPGYGPIEAEELKRYRFMKKLGFFGIDPDTREGAARFLRVGRSVLNKPNQTLWVTAQGFFHDARERPITLRPGVAHLARRAEGAVAVPLAVEYPFWFEKRPEMLLAFGQQIELGDTTRTTEQWNDTLTDALRDTMDRLAEVSLQRKPDRFTTLLEGRRGVGGVYDFWRRLRSKLGGKSFDPRHLPGGES